ncbi:hypothetical protein K491DRAFT_577001, partial [Lophiostoma macrostomum CBS 122681]
PRGKKRPQPNADEPKTTTISELKSRARNLRRLLEHVDNEPKHKMPANVRIDRERELQACEHELAEKTAAAREAEQRNRMIGKYHQVRFFVPDRQKATRILRKLQRQPLTDTESTTASNENRDTEELRQQIHRAEVDLNYAMYYPLMKPYSSLYPRGNRDDNRPEDGIGGVKSDDASSAKHRRGDVEMWNDVERAMEEGTLEELRNSSVGVPKPALKALPTRERQKPKSERKQKPQPNVAQNRREKRRAAQTQQDDEDSDGGFFE